MIEKNPFDQGGWKMKKSKSFLLATIMTVVLLLGTSAVGMAGPVEIKAVTYFPKNHPLVNPTCLKWFEMLNEGLKGKIHVKYVGGPEAVPPREQAEAVRNNMIQMAYTPIAVHRQLVPAAASFVVVKYKDAMELRESPFTDFLIKEYEKIGIRYIGPGTWGHFQMWSKKPIKKLADLKGMKMRSFFLYDRLQKALGITPVTIPTPELYTALERGVVEGFCFPQAGPRQIGWTKSAKYVIAHSFYTNDVVLLMNLDTWKKLPKDVQDKIDEITAKQYEPYMMKYANDLERNEWVALEKAGVTKVVLEPTEAKKFVDTAYRVKWEEIGEKVPADLLKKLKKMTLN
jgi:TRAP-type C4-dicarboxylate transport system substrate-binding protein